MEAMALAEHLVFPGLPAARVQMEHWVMAIIRVQAPGWRLKVGVVMEVPAVVWEEVRVVPELHRQLAVQLDLMAELVLHLQTRVPVVVEAVVLPEVRQMMVE